MSRHEYFVIDGDGMVSISIKKNTDVEPESFDTFAKAKKRARELAESAPGHAMVITQSVALVTCEIAPAKIEIRERKLQQRRTK
jgi:hypothetical protein